MESDKQKVLALVDKFMQSVNQGDVRPELIDELWERSPDVSNFNPQGHHKGFEDIRENFYSPRFALWGDRNLRTIGEPEVYIFDNTAIVEFYWKLDARLNNGGGKVDMQGCETQVMRKKNGEWKLVHLHYSGMPAKGARLRQGAS